MKIESKCYTDAFHLQFSIPYCSVANTRIFDDMIYKDKIRVGVSFAVCVYKASRNSCLKNYLWLFVVASFIFLTRTKHLYCFYIQYPQYTPVIYWCYSLVFLSWICLLCLTRKVLNVPNQHRSQPNRISIFPFFFISFFFQYA